jgi:outer membrane protein assembly factor BamB
MMKYQLLQSFAFILSISIWLHPGLHAADWPHFGGPNSDFTLPAIPGLATDWSANPPKEQWSVEVGDGFGGVAIADGRVYLFDRIQGEENALRCLDLKTGEEIWRYADPVPGRIQYPGSRGVPTVTDERVYAIGPFGNAYCVNRENGRLLWKIDQVDKFDGDTPRFGFAQSPLLVDDKIILAPLGRKHSLIAVDAKSGDHLWSVGGLLGTHSTPGVINLLGERFIVFATADTDTGKMVGVDPDTGEVKWTFTGYPNRIPIPTPITIGEDKLLATGGYSGGTKLLKASKGDEGITFEEIFYIQGGAQIHRPIVYENHIYMVANEGVGRGRGRTGGGRGWGRIDQGLVCLDLEGNKKWGTEFSPYFGRGAIMRIGEYFLLQDGLSGMLRLVEISPNSYKELASYNTFGTTDDKDHQMWAPLAVSGTSVLTRSQQKLTCLELPTSAE